MPVAFSWLGCLLALIPDLETGPVGFDLGDPLVLLFTFMMAAHLVLSTSIGGITESSPSTPSSLASPPSSGCTLASEKPSPPPDLSWTVGAAVVLIGLGTAGVFLLRCRSLQLLTPATVGAHHNFIPISTMAVAHLSPGQPLTARTTIGALAVLLGTELVRQKPA